MNLREKKKQATRETILRSARKLFFENGYSDTSIETIADCSQVAVGTIYNYFKSKAEIITAINSKDTDTIMIQFTDEELQTRTVEELVWAVLESSLAHLEQYPRELIRELFATSVGSNRSELAEGLTSQDERFINYFTELLERLRQSGKLKAETDSATVAFAIYSLVFGGIVWYLADERIDIEQSKILIASMVGQFCRGILPEGSY